MHVALDLKRDNLAIAENARRGGIPVRPGVAFGRQSRRGRQGKFQGRRRTDQKTAQNQRPEDHRACA